jgi:hypothetical protein
MKKIMINTMKKIRTYLIRLWKDFVNLSPVRQVGAVLTFLMLLVGFLSYSANSKTQMLKEDLEQELPDVSELAEDLISEQKKTQLFLLISRTF